MSEYKIKNIHMRFRRGNISRTSLVKNGNVNWLGLLSVARRVERDDQVRWDQGKTSLRLRKGNEIGRK
jgi:hypothetical protein